MNFLQVPENINPYALKQTAALLIIAIVIGVVAIAQDMIDNHQRRGPWGK